MLVMCSEFVICVLARGSCAFAKTSLVETQATIG